MRVLIDMKNIRGVAVLRILLVSFFAGIFGLVSVRGINADSTVVKASLYNPVMINQLGYTVTGRKVFYSSKPARKFIIRNEENGEIVFSGPMVYEGFDTDTGMDIRLGDFSVFHTPGKYFVEVIGAGKSSPFEIKDDVYNKALILTSRFFYHQRSGIDTLCDDGQTVIKKGHIAEAFLWGDNRERKNVSGGWYDAGDYGRYMPTASFSVSMLLYAYEFNPDFFKDGALGLPESGNGIPDLLDEIEWELSWMLKMQTKTGSVYHKVTTMEYPEMGTLPAEDTAPLYLFGPTSVDTAYFSAVMARSARVLERNDSEFARKCRVAALKSCNWLLANPNQIPSGGFHNPPPSVYPMQGGYDFSGSENDARMWAAAELYRLTGKENMFDTFKALYKSGGHKTIFKKMDWSDPYAFALYTFLSGSDKSLPLYKQVYDDFINQTDKIMAVSKKSLLYTSLAGREGPFAYVWGSNEVVSANGVELIMAYKLTGDERYLMTAENQLHYLLGCNGLSKIFLSGIGSNPVKHPHHNLSIYCGRAVSGIVGEGPDGAVDEGSGGDMILNRLWENKIPAALCYADNEESWATNEPTIDANAAFTALLSWFTR